jgi:DNA-binding transcriptional ArsR family regulator
MDRKTRSRYETRARVLKALAHPSRLLMVDELARQERCVCELTEMVGADMSTVSKHLAILRNAGLVEMEKRGAQVYYSLRVTCVTGFFNCLEEVMRSAAEEQLELVAIR